MIFNGNGVFRLYVSKVQIQVLAVVNVFTKLTACLLTAGLLLHINISMLSKAHQAFFRAMKKKTCIRWKSLEVVWIYINDRNVFRLCNGFCHTHARAHTHTSTKNSDNHKD